MLDSAKGMRSTVAFDFKNGTMEGAFVVGNRDNFLGNFCSGFVPPAGCKLPGREYGLAIFSGTKKSLVDKFRYTAHETRAATGFRWKTKARYIPEPADGDFYE